MNIQVQCPCGQGYMFDVEPVNGAMPYTVNCPTCGADGTQLANHVILESQFTPPPTGAPPISGLRINRPPASAAAPAGDDKPQKFGITRTLEPDKAPPPSQENIPMGILGGIGAGFIAMLIWYSLTVATGYQFGIVAWGVGVLAGVGVRVLGRDGTNMLGFIAAVCACVAVLGGEFLVTNHYINKFVKIMAVGIYDENIAAARKVVNFKTDSEVQAWIEKNRDDGTGFVPKSVEEFNSTGRAKMQDFLDGKPSRAEYEKKMVAQFSTFEIKFKIFKESVSLMTVLWLIFGVASAYRIGSS